jgi:hypothetical protein
MMEDLVPVGSRVYFFFLMLLLVSRGADFFSTWIATPTLVLEGNPLARKLGWKWGSFVNLVLCGAFAAWPVAAIVIGTTSALVAARNFQAAWLMRSLGEESYRDWYVEQVRHASLPTYLVCLAGQILPTACVGGALMYFCGDLLIPFAVGFGIIGYALAVMFYTLLAFWRIRRAPAAKS